MSDHADLPTPGLKLGEEPPRIPDSIEGFIAAVVMGVLCVITFANVVVRYFSNASIAWTEEISVFLMIVMTLVGGCAAMARDRHIKIEYFLEAGSAEYAHAFTCAIGRNNVFAVQFHPEKSAKAGLRLLANFVAWQPTTFLPRTAGVALEH